MSSANNLRSILTPCAALIVFALFGSAKAADHWPVFNPKNFSHSTKIDNKWYPIEPGMSYTWDGFAVDDEGDQEAHSVVFTVTDLVKENAGVKTVVCYDRDFVDKE